MLTTVRPRTNLVNSNFFFPDDRMFGSRRGDPGNRLPKTAACLLPNNAAPALDVETLFVAGHGDDELAVEIAESTGLAAKSFPSGSEALEAAIGHCRGCLLVESQLADMSGLALLGELNKQGSILPTIVCVDRGDVSSAVEAMRLGAVTVLETPCSKPDMIAAVSRAIEQERQRRAAKQKAVEMSTRLSTLNSQEIAIVDMILQGVSNKVIAARMGFSMRTAENRRRKLYKVMGASNVADFVHRVLLARYVDWQ